MENVFNLLFTSTTSCSLRDDTNFDQLSFKQYVSSCIILCHQRKMSLLEK